MTDGREGAEGPKDAEGPSTVEPPEVRDRQAADHADAPRSPRMPVPVERLREGRDVSTLPFPRHEPVAPGSAARPPSAPRRGPRSLIAIGAAIVVFLLGVSTLLLQRELAPLRTYTEGVDAAFQAVAREDARPVVLASPDGSVAGFAAVLPDGAVRLAVHGLPPTLGTQVVAAWLVPDGEPPVAIGAFSVGTDGTAVVDAAIPGGSGADIAGATIGLSVEAVPGVSEPALPFVASGIVDGG